jgi:hypothetical protein
MWADKRNAIDYDIFAQRINNAGSVQWAANGIPVAATTGSQSAIDASTDGVTNGIFIVWKDSRNNYEHVYGQYLNAAGNASFASNGVMLSNNTLTQLNPNMNGVGNNEVVVTWQDSSNGNWDIYAQKMSLQSATEWGNSGVLISDATGNQLSPKNCSNGNGGSIFTFQDRRGIDFDIYASQIKSNGTFTNVSSLTSNNIVSIYPNPAHHELNINSNDQSQINAQLIICDMLGNTVLSENINANKFDISQLSNGIYLVKIISNKDEVITQQKLNKHD